MKRLVTAFALIASTASPALANECPLLQAQIDKAIGPMHESVVSDKVSFHGSAG